MLFHHSYLNSSTVRHFFQLQFGRKYGDSSRQIVYSAPDTRKHRRKIVPNWTESFAILKEQHTHTVSQKKEEEIKAASF